MSAEKVREFRAKMDAEHKGVSNAYKTLHLGGGADATVVGVDLKQLEFSVTQGHGETRIAAAGNVPPVIVGLSEGLAAATYSNYGQARRRLADVMAHPLWQNVAGSFAHLLPSQGPGTRLWYDARDVPFLREDEKDSADIQFIQAQSMGALITAGYLADSVTKAVLAGDMSLLQHSGLYSVQMQKPGTDQTPPDATPPAAEPPTTETP
jgi:phage portal protein BeeE